MKKSEQSISLYPILAVNFVGTLGFSIVLPFLVFLVIRLGGNALIYGIMGATYSVFQMIGAPVLGKWSDRFGRRKILLLSQGGTLFSWIIFLAALYLPPVTFAEVNTNITGTFSLTLPLLVLFFARALDGLTGGNVSVANAYLADISNEQERTGNFGKMAVSANLGFVLGPAIAGGIGATRFGETVPVLVAILISLAATLIILFQLPESRRCIIKKDPQRGDMHKVFGQEHMDCYRLHTEQSHSLQDIIRLKNIPLLLSIYFLVFLGFNFFYIAFPVHAVQSLNWELTDTGIFFSILGLLMALVQGPVLGYTSRRFSEAYLIINGSLMLALSFVFIYFEQLTYIYLGAFLLALGNGIMWPSLLAVLSSAADTTYQGAIQGVAGAAGSLASILGLMAGGILYEQTGPAVFLLSAGIIFVVFILSFKTAAVKHGKKELGTGN